MATHSITVSGYVQGVGFRYFVLQTANANGIVGEVWNASDQTVRITAQHEDENRLKIFEEELWNGPGRVDNVLISPAVVQPFEGFRIKK